MDTMSDDSIHPFNIPADKTYAVVELVHKNLPYSTPVPTCWLYDLSACLIDGVVIKEASCYWPKDEKKLSDLVEKRKKPDPSNKDRWTSCRVKVLRLCRSLVQAKKKSEDALDKSELSSESDMGISSKRRRTGITMFDASHAAGSKIESGGKKLTATELFGTDSDSSDADSVPLNNMKILKNKKISQSPKETGLRTEKQSVVNRDSSRSPDSAADEKAISKLPNDSGDDTDGDSMRKGSPSTPLVSHTPGLEEQSTEVLILPVNASQTNLNGSGTSQSGVTSFATSSRQSSTPRKTLFSPRKHASPKMSPYKKFVMQTKACGGNCPCMKELVRHRQSLDKANAKLDKIIIAVCPDIELSGNANLERRNNVPGLPIEDEEGEEKWKTFTKDEQNKAIVVPLLANHGSPAGGRESTYGVLRKLISNKVAAGYNFKGKNKPDVLPKKKSFEKSLYYDVVIAAIRRHNDKLTKTKNGFDCGKSVLDSYIMDWLKDAPKRHRKEIDAKTSDD